MWVYDKQDKVEQKVKNYLDMSPFPLIQGHDFDKDFDFQKFFQSYLQMGFQGSQLGVAMEMLKEILAQRKKGLQLYLSFTGNMISSGNRELINFLVKHKHIDGITTTAAALEEDIIKCIKPFHLGNFEAKGKFLLDECIGRIGNILVPADRYLYLERFLNAFFPRIHKKGKILCTHEVAKEAGLFMADNEHTKDHREDSFLYWAAKNEIPIFCPALTDGALGDISTFYKRNNPDFAIDMVGDNAELTKRLMNAEAAACIILGGGVAKHFLLNSAIFRDGFEYCIYITTAQEFDGSDSGGNQEEAISWAKIKPDAKRVKVVADATIVFPLLMAAAFARKK